MRGKKEASDTEEGPNKRSGSSRWRILSRSSSKASARRGASRSRRQASPEAIRPRGSSSQPRDARSGSELASGRPSIVTQVPYYRPPVDVKLEPRLTTQELLEAMATLTPISQASAAKNKGKGPASRRASPVRAGIPPVPRSPGQANNFGGFFTPKRKVIDALKSEYDQLSERFHSLEARHAAMFKSTATEIAELAARAKDAKAKAEETSSKLLRSSNVISQMERVLEQYKTQNEVLWEANQGLQAQVAALTAQVEGGAAREVQLAGALEQAHSSLAALNEETSALRAHTVQLASRQIAQDSLAPMRQAAASETPSEPSRTPLVALAAGDAENVQPNAKPEGVSLRLLTKKVAPTPPPKVKPSDGSRLVSSMRAVFSHSLPSAVAGAPPVRLFSLPSASTPKENSASAANATSIPAPVPVPVPMHTPVKPSLAARFEEAAAAEDVPAAPSPLKEPPTKKPRRDSIPTAARKKKRRKSGRNSGRNSLANRRRLNGTPIRSNIVTSVMASPLKPLPPLSPWPRKQ